MKKIPSKIETVYLSLMREKVSEQVQTDYLKWLNFYLDFCSKYGLGETQPENLQKFIIKLEQKNQTKTQLEQAQSAISLFYEIESVLPFQPQKFRSHVWNKTLSDLETEIKLRHYSPLPFYRFIQLK